MNFRRGPALLEFTVPGQPAGAGSKTAEPLGKRGKEVRDHEGRIVLKYRPASKFTEPWMELVGRHARIHWMAKPPIDGHIWLDAAFYELRPKSHYFRRKSGDVLRPDAPAFPSVTDTHDKDKMQRALCDPLTQARVIADDKRIVGGEAWKLYADQPPHRACAVIRLGLMEAKTAEELGAISPPTQDALLDA